jgi:tyrosine-protein kinase Etk/Wzc
LTACVVFLLGLVLVYSITPLYEASASLMPQSKEDSSGLATLFSSRSPGDVFTGLLASRSVADDVIDRTNLLEIYKTSSREKARNILAGSSTFATGKDTLVTIKVRNRDAQTAMRIANAYLDGLENQREKMLLHEGEAHSRFFQQQIAQEAAALSAAEQSLKQVQERSGVVQPEAQTAIGLNAIAGVRGQITSLQVELSALLLGASDQNPQVRALRAQIAQLQGQEHALESASGAGGAGAAASAKQMPELNLEYARRQREVKYHEVLFNSISTQYEVARLNVGNSGAPFVIVDKAVVPEVKAWPLRKLLLLLVFAFSVIIGFVTVGIRLLWRKLRADSLQDARFAAIRNSFSRGR